MESTKIASLDGRPIINSHVQWTTEFIVGLPDGRRGSGSAPRGETTSVYEERPVAIDPREIVRRMTADGCLDMAFTQVEFDRFVGGYAREFGRNNAFALSVAFHAALSSGGVAIGGSVPGICLNVLNGGWHAYTNPVRSDFAEYLLVPRRPDLRATLFDHARIQAAVKAGLASKERSVVNGNVVHELGGNRGCVRFLLGILDDLKLGDGYDVMVDASAGDLRKDGAYRLEVTGEGSFSPSEFVRMWKGMIDECDLGVLEDPFAEDDAVSWTALTADRGRCQVIGDNLYATDAGRIAKGAAERWTTGVLIKPDQAGSVTATKEAIRACEEGGQLMISSHRSISTESTVLTDLTMEHKIPYIKVGPLATDYSAVMRVNEFLRHERSGA